MSEHLQYCIWPCVFIRLKAKPLHPWEPNPASGQGNALLLNTPLSQLIQNSSLEKVLLTSMYVL